MSRWLVTQDNAQFSVEGLDELCRLASSGELDEGDMVQCPGATDWQYASEVPELSRFFGAGGTLDDDDDLDWHPRRFGGLGVVGSVAIGAVLVAVIAVGALSMAFFYSRMPTEQDKQLIGGESGLTYSQMLVTNPKTPLLDTPDDKGKTVLSLAKDTKLELLAKRGDFYKARTPSGQEGWVTVHQVVPMYLYGGGEVMAKYDPLYNPDRYVTVKNASWLQLDQKNSQLTVFRFMIDNQSRYAMTDLVLLAVIKDSKGNELERVEIPVEGTIPPSDSSMVGTLAPEDKSDPDAKPRSITEYTFSKLAESDPDLALLYSDGVEVEMSTQDFTEADIDLLQVRAIPLGKDVASKDATTLGATATDD